MSVKLIVGSDRLTAVLLGEIDHHSAKGIREKIDTAILENHPQELTLNFSQVSFMDSSGIGLVIGRFKAMQEVDGKIVIEGASQQITKVMRLSGIDRLATIKN